MSPTILPAPASSADSAAKRLLSLDAYRGLIMISLAFAGFGLRVARTAGGLDARHGGSTPRSGL